jgi:hypothetical protein
VPDGEGVGDVQEQAGRSVTSTIASAARRTVTA